MARAQQWVVWVAATASSVVVSYFVWWFWGTAFCGDEVYDTPAGSAGDTLCGVMVKPIWPWAIVAATPTLLSLFGGLLGLILRRPRLYSFSLAAPVVLGIVTFFLAPALF
jgi:hypothetical protein